MPHLSRRSVGEGYDQKLFERAFLAQKPLEASLHQRVSFARSGAGHYQDIAIGSNGFLLDSRQHDHHSRMLTFASPEKLNGLDRSILRWPNPSVWSGKLNLTASRAKLVLRTLLGNFGMFKRTLV
jgi:hypothetical protein